MDRSIRSQSPGHSRSKSPIAKPTHQRRCTTGNAILDHSLRIDYTRRTDNARRTSMKESPPTERQDNRTATGADTASTKKTAGGGGGLRGRAYSWRGENSPFSKLDVETQKGCCGGIQPSELIPMMNREARSVVAWVCVSALLQLTLSFVTQLASYHPSSIASNNNWILQQLLQIPAILSGLVLEILPQKVFQNKAPGFLYASAWYVVRFVQ